MPFQLFGIPKVIRIDIPALSELVGFLKDVDAREQRNLQRVIGELTARLKQTNDQVQDALKKGEQVTCPHLTK